MSAIAYRGYTAKVDFDPQDDIFVGRLTGINDMVGFHAETVEGLKAAFHEAVDDYVAACAAAAKPPEKPYSGKLMVRVAPEVHARAALAAQLSGRSLSPLDRRCPEGRRGPIGGGPPSRSSARLALDSPVFDRNTARQNTIATRDSIKSCLSASPSTASAASAVSCCARSPSTGAPTSRWWRSTTLARWPPTPTC